MISSARAEVWNGRNRSPGGDIDRRSVAAWRFQPALARRRARMMPDRGYMTVATGDPRYLEFAVDLALSLRQWNPEPTALLLGDELRPFATPAHLAPFDFVMSMPAGYPGALGKLATPAATPFARTLFVDADSVAIGSLAEAWRNLAPATFAVQGRYLDPGEDKIHHRFSTAALARRFGVERYLRNSAGLLYFRKDEGIAIAEACMRFRETGFAGLMPFEDILLALLGARLGISTIPHPLPMPWWPDIVEPGDDRYRIVHVMGPLKAPTMTWLLREIRERRDAAGLPRDASVMFWLRKALGRDPRYPTAKGSASDRLGAIR